MLIKIIQFLLSLTSDLFLINNFTMYTLCIDPGINNLSICIMSCDNLNKKDISKYKIELWELYNVLDNEVELCQKLQKNGKICNKKCSYKCNEGDFTCKLHFPKELDIKDKKHSYKKKNIDKYLLHDIVKSLLLKIEKMYIDNKELFDKLTDILIELQPKVNRKSIMVSHVLYSKFIDIFKDKKINIKFVSASKKLLAYDGPFIECKLKSPYAQRKWLSIQYIKYFLENKFSEEEKEKWLILFESQKVQSDMSDAALMSINSIFGIPKKEKTIKKKRTKKLK